MLKTAFTSLLFSLLLLSISYGQKTPTAARPKSDAAVAADKLAAANRNDEREFRRRVSKFGSKRLKIFGIDSAAVEIGRTRLAATLVYDATSALAKLDGKTRAAEAEKLLAKIVARLLAKAQFEPGAWTRGSAKLIYDGRIMPSFDNVRAVRDEIRIVLNVVVKNKLKNEIVAFADISTAWNRKTK